MKKKILAILMATLTVGSLLSGCGGAQSSDANGNQESSKQESSDSEEPAEVVFAYMTQNNIPESSELERIQNLINDYTVDKINTKVKLVLFSNSDYMNQVNLMLASGEQIDLFQSLNTPHLKYMKDGTALDITAYLDDELKETKEIVEKKKPEKKKLPEAIRKKIRTELKDEKLPAGKYTSIYKAVEESENKLALNNALVKTFDTTIGSKIYNHIKKIYEDYQR